MLTRHETNGVPKSTIENLIKNIYSNENDWHLINGHPLNKNIKYLYHNIYYNKTIKSNLFSESASVLNTSGEKIKNIIHICSFMMHKGDGIEDVIKESYPKNFKTLFLFLEDTSGVFCVESDTDETQFDEYEYKKGSYLVFDSNKKHYFSQPTKETEVQTIIKIVFESI